MKQLRHYFLLAALLVTSTALPGQLAQRYQMDKGAFKKAAQQIADGIANGAEFNLKDVLTSSPEFVAKIIGKIPGPFKHFYEKITFEKDLSITIDESNQVAVIKGKFKVPFLIPETFVDGLIKVSSDLTQHDTAKTAVKPSGKKMSKDEANKAFHEGMTNLIAPLQFSTILNFEDHYKPREIAEAVAKSKGVSNDIKSEANKIAPLLKPLDDIIKGDLSLAFATENYTDSQFGQIQTQGLNAIATVNLFAKFTDALTKKILSTLGSSPKFSKGLTVSIFIPRAILGTTITVALPGQMVFGVPKGPKLAQIDRLQISSKAGGTDNISAGFLNASIKGTLELFAPWQKKPIVIDVIFGLDTGGNVMIHGDINDLKVPGLPFKLDQAFAEIQIDAVQLIKTVVDTVIYLVESAGEQGVTVATAGTTAEVTEVAEAGETVKEVGDIVAMLFPINLLGVGGKVEIAGRTTEANFCFEYNQAQEKINLALVIELANGKEKDFLGIKDLWNVFLELQEKTLEALEGVAKTAQFKEMEATAKELLKLNRSLSSDILDKLPDFNIKTAFLYLVPLKTVCNQKKLRSGIELEVSGTFLGESFEGDIVLNIFGLLDLIMQLVGEVVSIAQGDPVEGTEEVIEEGTSSMADRIKDMIKNIPSAAGKGLKAIGKKAGSSVTKKVTGGKVKLGGSQSGGSDGSAAGLVKTALGTVGGFAMGFLNMGIYGRFKLGELNFGPMHLSSADGKGGPNMIMKLGFATPQGPAESRKDFTKQKSMVLGAVIDGKAELAIPPGFEGDVLATLGIGGLELIAHGKMGAFNALVDGGVYLNPLKDNITIDIYGGWQQIASSINAGLKQVTDAAKKGVGVASKDVQSKVGNLEKAVSHLQDKVRSTQKLIDDYNTAMDKCAKGNPAAEALNGIRQKIQNTIKSTFHPEKVFGMMQDMLKLTNVSYTASQIGQMKNLLAKKAATAGNPLGSVTGLAQQKGN